MTRKDYIKLAEIIKNNARNDSSSNGLNTFIYTDEIVDDLCKFLKEDNPNFNEQKFREACE